MQDKLKFSEFEVSMIYGFETEPHTKNFFKTLTNNKKKFSKGSIRDGWSSTYQIHSETNQVIQRPCPPATRYEKDLKILEEKTKSPKWLSENATLSGKISKFFTVRKDGAGALTLTFKFNENTHYSTSDILRVLLLVSRTMHGKHENECSKVSDKLSLSSLLTESANKSLTPPVKKSLKNLSLPFQLFVTTMLNSFETTNTDWNEISLKRLESKKLTPSPIYDNLDFSTDPQIPYMFVFAKVSYEQYRNAFLEEGLDMKRKRVVREKYSKEIAAILGRWLNSHNIPFASGDYWEQRDAMKDSTFYSKYMNSLVFTTFSGLVTLSLYPDLDESEENKFNKQLMTKPIEVTHSAILRCLEFSRLRWHHAISLNRELDFLIKDIARSPKTGDFIPLLNRLITVEEKVGLHLEDPNSYLWDASVGSHIAEFLHQRVIEKIEDEITKKLEHVRNLLNDKLKMVRTIAYVNELLRKEET